MLSNKAKLINMDFLEIFMSLPHALMGHLAHMNLYFKYR